MGGIPFGPGGLETVRERSAWWTFLVLIRSRKIRTIGKEAGDVGKRSKTEMEAKRETKTSPFPYGSQTRSPEELHMGRAETAEDGLLKEPKRSATVTGETCFALQSTKRSLGLCMIAEHLFLACPKR